MLSKNQRELLQLACTVGGGMIAFPGEHGTLDSLKRRGLLFKVYRIVRGEEARALRPDQERNHPCSAGHLMTDELWAYAERDAHMTAIGLMKFAKDRGEILRLMRRMLNPNSDLDFTEQERIRRAGRRLPSVFSSREWIL